MTDSELLERFETAALSGEEFPHREHVRVAWIYLRERPLHEVLDRFPRHLRALANALGAAGLYHETVTWFFLMLVHDRIARNSCVESWDRFADANPDLMDRSSEVMTRYYKEQTWQSPLAKERFLLPDASRA
ncbi:MAG: hypothetical protein WC538_16470 [Thermoanaerobaculia bacterium]